MSKFVLASPLYVQEREANADRSQVYHSVRENLMSTSSQDPKSTERPVAWFIDGGPNFNRKWRHWAGIQLGEVRARNAETMGVSGRSGASETHTSSTELRETPEVLATLRPAREAKKGGSVEGASS